MSDGVRCPFCGAKVAEALEGRLEFRCRKCKRIVSVAVNCSTIDTFAYTGAQLTK